MGGKTLQAFDPSKSSILELTEMGQEYGCSGMGREEQIEKMMSSGLDVLSLRKK